VYRQFSRRELKGWCVTNVEADEYPQSAAGSISALLQETNTRHREQNAIHKAEEARKGENAILYSQTNDSSGCLDLSG